MFRLFIIICILHTYCISLAQTSKRELNFLVNQNIEQEDFTEAAKYCELLVQKDSLNYKLLEKYVDVLLKIKNFKKADFVLKRIINSKEKKINFKTCYFQLGFTNKQLGSYDEAINFYEESLKYTNKKNDKSTYLKIEQEIQSCAWAKENCKDTLAYNIDKLKSLTNGDSKFGHAIIDSQIIISSLSCVNCNDSIGFVNTGYTNKLYVTSKENNTLLKEIKTLNSSTNHTSNGTFSLDKKKFYFCTCNNLPTNKKCKLLVSNYKNGVWSSPDTLKGEVNDNNFSYTMPSFAKIEGKEYLFFCSDANNSIGGLDIYIGLIKQNTIQEIKPLKYINSIEDDITPFFDNENSILYFASSWFNGFGGFDLFKSTYIHNKTSKIENLGIPFNSSNNDIYLIKDSLNYFITSNRNHNSGNKTCCNDIYFLKPKQKQLDKTCDSIKSDKTNTSQNNKNIPSVNREKLEKLLPISLYFHNDIPNPKSLDSSTSLNYFETYEEYRQLLQLYKSQNSDGLRNTEKLEAALEIEKFFSENLEKGKKNLDEFLEILIEELKKGKQFELIFKGYASPLAKNDYNKLLSKRRISAVKNYISFYKNGVFLNYILEDKNGETKLNFKEVSFGEYLSDKLVSDNPNDKKNSIYSKKAALERKVEIIGFRIK